VTFLWPMTFSIITPSFKQLDWLRLCVASVRDQINIASNEMRKAECEMRNAISVVSDFAQRERSGFPTTIANSTSDFQMSCFKLDTLTVEHIIQDAGSPGIEDFAREVKADFYRDGALVFASPLSSGDSREAHVSTHQPSTLDSRPYRIAIHCESDCGMYDAINRGLVKATGEIVAHLNSDEQYLPAAFKSIAGIFSAESNLDLLYASAVILRRDGEYICQRDPVIPNATHVCISHLHTLTASTFFRRETITQKGLYFSTEFLALGDAEWALRALQSGLQIKAVPFLSSAFFEAESNLGISQESMAERERLRETVPRWKRTVWPLWIIHHLARRLLAGHYSRDPFEYAVYTPRFGISARKSFRVKRPSAIYPKYLKIIIGK